MIIPCPEVAVVDSEHTHMHHLSTEYYVRGTHSQCVAVVTTCKIASIGDDYVESDVCSRSSGMDAIDHH
jgi:hypothetical protein